MNVVVEENVLTQNNVGGKQIARKRILNTGNLTNTPKQQADTGTPGLIHWRSPDSKPYSLEMSV
jgi:hypothetical protein